MFLDRRDAGRRLANLLADQPGATWRGPADADPTGRESTGSTRIAEPAPVIVIGLARGGVVVAAEVADKLGAPLDVMIVRKIGCPWQPELGVGAIAEGGGQVLNDALIADLRLAPTDLEPVIGRERVELERRVRHYRGDRPPIAVAGRTVVLVDDGLATGFTARAAIRALRDHGAARVILAVPVASPDAVAAMGSVADRVVAAEQPEWLGAIGELYDDFSQTGDEEVLAILAAHRSGRDDRAGPHGAGGR